MAVSSSIIVVNFNQKPALQALLTALEMREAPTAELLVVDSASFDGSAEMVEEKFPAARLIRLKDNRGFAAGGQPRHR